MRTADTQIRGLIAALPTPFVEDRVDDLGFEENLGRLESYPLDGYLVGGTTGEMSLLTPAERWHLVRRARAVAGRSRVVLAGIAGDSVAAAAAEAAEAADAGAAAVLLGAPAAQRALLTDAVARRFFIGVAERAPIPVIVYSNPGTPGGEIALPVVLECLDHPHVAALKDSSRSAERLEFCLAARAGRGRVLAGSAALFDEALARGADGGILALASLYPGEFHAIRAAVAAGRDVSLTRRALDPVIEFFRRTGLPGLKALFEAAGHAGGPMRAPFDARDDGILREARVLIRAVPPLPPC